MFCSSRWVAKLWRSVCGATHLGSEASFGSHVADAIELARSHWADAVAAREYPYRRARDAPPVA
jgi:hypothetical protein